MKIINDNLITLTKKGNFDVIAHGCNCFCSQGAGIANAMRLNFRTDEFPCEEKLYRGKYNKLGTIEYKKLYVDPFLTQSLFEEEDNIQNNFHEVYVCNAYTQFNPGKDLDLSALVLCLKKIRFAFKGKKIGLPLIGGGIAGGDIFIIRDLIRKIFEGEDVTLVILETELYNKLKI